MKSSILVIDDEQDACDLLAAALDHDGANTVSTTSAQAAFDLVSSGDFDAVLTDLNMTEMDGLNVCERIHAINPHVPVIVVTGLGTLDAAISAMRAGAYDFITKPVDPKLLSLSVSRAVQHKRVQAEVTRLRETVESMQPPAGIIGSSRAMRRVHDVIVRVSGTEAPILIQGETGVGKELIARRTHEMSANKRGPFIAINCAAIPPTLLESELFGHARGAFTDAKAERTGLFVQANHGTLFLDEIGELPLELQPKLLRALQERVVRPVGGHVEVPFDARIVAASNRELEDEVEAKRFREDLFYRINVVRLVVPPLRERDSDVLELAQFFLNRHAQRAGGEPLKISAAVAKKLLDYRWPGNVRELENCMARAVAFARFEELTIDDLPEKVRSYEADRFVVSANDELEVVTLEELERRYVQRVLTLVGGNKSRAAQILGVDRRTLYRKAEKWGENGTRSSTPSSGSFMPS
jgi:two-component system response regulator HydG